MHIPDGYLGPQTYVPAYAAALPFWVTAATKVKRSLPTTRVPLLALGAAFCFVIMMFNIPIPGGTTGHAVGAVLLAVLLGPWEAVLAVSLVLLVQALLFGDGGVTAYGANCLTMAIVMPFSGWAVYRLIAGKADPRSTRHWIGAATGGYVGLNAAALLTSVLLGIQPALAHDSAGHALYCPFGLGATLPAIAGSHLLVFGFIEAIATGLVLAYLRRADPSLLQESLVRAKPRQDGVLVRAGLALFILAMLTPLGFALPKAMRAGAAWGEWGSQEVAVRTGYAPRGMRNLENIWHAPIPDYALGQSSPGSEYHQAFEYAGAGLLGALFTTSLILALRNGLARKEPTA